MGNQERVGQNVGDYHLLRWLGGGGFGNVYLAEHTHDGHQVAMKVLQTRLTNPNDWRAFLNEARTMHLHHPHIMPLLDFGLSQQEEPFLVMEYAPKGTLRDRHPKGTRVLLPAILDYVTQIASALQYAHEQHLIHRDVKPENMLLRSDDVLLLSDFGIATAAHSSNSLSAHIGVGGTVPYMAPEQLRGRPRAASDQYALAVVIYEWLTGHRPFEGTAVEVVMQHTLKVPPPLHEQVAGLPHEVEEVLFKALAKDPKERFASVQAMALALQQASTLPTPPLPTPHTPEEQPPARMIPTLSGVDATSSPKYLPLKAISSSVSPSTKITIIPSVQKLGHSKAFRALLMILILLLIGSGGTYIWTTNTYRLAATATAVTLREDTTRTKIASTATAKEAISAYNTYVTQHGIMFGFDAQHSRNNPYERILNVSNVSRLHQAWFAPTGNSISSSPAVAHGLVYIGSYHHTLCAFNATTGEQKWVSSPTENVTSSAPAVANGLAYVGSWDNKLYAFNATTGERRWVASTGDAILSSPVVANGLVYVGSGDYKLYAFDAATGEQKWVAPTGSYMYSSPAVANGLVYVGSGDYKLYAFDAATGEQKWATSTGSFISSSPAVANGLVYVGSGSYKLYAFDATTGKQKWVSFHAGSLMVKGLNDSSPAVANSLVYVGSGDTKLHAFDATTGEEKWATSTGAGISSSPTVANGLVYVGSHDHKLYAFDAATGQQKWVSSPTGNIISSSPAIVNGIIYVGSEDGKLYAFSLP